MNSDSLIAAGKEAILDVMVSVATVLTAFLYIATGIGIEAYVATVIAVIIIKTGFELLKETISKMLGEPSEVQLVVDIKNTIKEFPKVNGAYDLVLNNYGPDNYMASVHIEVDDTLSVKQVDVLTREITAKVIEQYGVILTAIGVYSHNTTNAGVAELEKKVKEQLMSYEFIKGIHGFYVDLQKKEMRFDVVVSFDAKNRMEVYQNALEEVKNTYKEYTIYTAMDADFNELVK